MFLSSVLTVGAAGARWLRAWGRQVFPASPWHKAGGEDRLEFEGIAVRKIIVGLAHLLGAGLLLLASQILWVLPLPRAWELSIGATEWGHWLAPPCFLLALALAQRRATRLAAALALSASGLFALPVAQALAFQQHHPGSDFSLTRLYAGQAVTGFSKKTLEYSQDQSLDLYLPQRSSPRHGLIVVHGGSWARGSKNEFASLNGYMAARGWAVAALNYRLAPAHPWPAALEDLMAARQFLGHQGIAPDWSWLGRSAGGHLALLACYQAQDPAVVAYYPPTDMLWSYQHPSNPRVLDSCQALRDFLGGTPEQLPEVYRQASPMALGPWKARVLLLHGLRDDLVYPAQSERLQAQIGASCQLVEFPWANHGFDINFWGPSGQLSTSLVERFLEAQP